jgi:hypothetical protein
LKDLTFSVCPLVALFQNMDNDIPDPYSHLKPEDMRVLLGQKDSVINELREDIELRNKRIDGLLRAVAAAIPKRITPNGKKLTRLFKQNKPGTS